jgi:hypothetical protein
MVVLPVLTMVIVLPSIVATAGFELVYVITPSLLVVGATKLKDASANVFTGTEKLLRTEVIFVTVSTGPTTSYPLTLKTDSFLNVQVIPSVEVETKLLVLLR